MRHVPLTVRYNGAITERGYEQKQPQEPPSVRLQLTVKKCAPMADEKRLFAVLSALHKQKDGFRTSFQSAIAADYICEKSHNKSY